MNKKYPINLIGTSGKILDKNSASMGVDWLEQNGFEVINPVLISREYLRFSGKESDRAFDVNNLAQMICSAGENQKIIGLALRGGYGLSPILPDIDWWTLGKAVDKGLVLVGHSDFTALSIGLFSKTGKSSLAGPMLSPDFCEKTISSFTWNSFLSAIDGRFQILVPLEQKLIDSALNIEKAVIWGGNLSILVSLLGTDYFPDEQLIKGGILFLEDINEHPYRIERMLIQLALSGSLNNQQAIVFGDFTGYKLSEIDEDYDINTVLIRVKNFLKKNNLAIPILTGLPFGHIKDKVTLPIGIKCNLNANNQGFQIQGDFEI